MENLSSHQSVEEDQVTLTDYVQVDTESRDSDTEKDDTVDSNDVKEVKRLLFDKPLYIKLQEAISYYTIDEKEEAKYAIEVFYDNIAKKVAVEYKRSASLHMFEGHGILGRIFDGRSTNQRVWKAMQNPDIRRLAIEMCAKEKVRLELNYGNNKNEWSWSMMIPV